MELVKELHSQGVHIYNVNEKVPADYSDDIPRYYSKDELSSRKTNVNFDIPRVGMRVGQQKSEFDFIICLDFDCYDGNCNFNQEVATKCQELQTLTSKEGFYSTSTDGNYQCLINIGMCPSLISKIKSLGKQKIELFKKDGLIKNSTALELILMDWNVCLPPTRTINKRNKQIGEERKWLTDKSYFVLAKTSRVYDWLNELIPEPPRSTMIVESKEEIEVVLEGKNESKTDNEVGSEVLELVHALPVKYLMDRDLWIRIGMIMKNEGYSVQDWAQVSRSVDSFQNEPDSTYESQWRSFRNDKTITKASLWYWLKQEDQNKFKELRNKYSPIVKGKKLQLTELDLAHELIQRYRDDFIALPSTKPTSPPRVFRYNGDIWTDLDSYNYIMSLITFLGKEIVEQINSEINQLNKVQVSGDDETDKRNEITNQIKELKNYVKKAISLTHKTSNRKHIREEFVGLLRPVDGQIFNQDPDVLHFQNGKLCLKTGTLLPRCKEDYCTKVIDYEYHQQSNDKIKWVYDLLSKIVPSQSERLGLLDHLGYCITGHTNQHYIKINYGLRGNNGKTLICEFLDIALEPYVLKLENKTFNKGEKDAHKTLVCLLDEPIRIAYIEELDEQELQVNALKTFTDSKLSVKPLYRNQITGRHTAKLIINTNIEPRFKKDGGILRRLRIQEFIVRFLKKHQVKTGAKYEYYEDPTLTQLFTTDDSLKCAFIQVLLHHAMKYYKEGLTLPSTWEQLTEEVAEANDIWGDFQNYFHITNDDTDRVSKEEILDLVKMKKPNATWIDARQALKLCTLWKYWNKKARVQGYNSQGALIGVLLTNSNQLMIDDELEGVD